VASEIPIRNIYYLLCYAWDQLQEGETIDVLANDIKSLPELFARVLAQGTQHLVKRGFDRGYVICCEETPRIRGKLNLSVSMTRQTWRHGNMVCEFDELSHNILHNRILKTTINSLLQTTGIGSETLDLLYMQSRNLSLIDSVHITSGLFRRVHLHRNNHFYKFLMNVCELIHNSKLPEQKDGIIRFRDFIRDPKQMPHLFEKFVRNFYRREQSEFVVTNTELKWNARGTSENLAVIPVMKTDVSLYSKKRSIIMDCKFYKEAMAGYYGNDKIHSANLYQLYAYLRNADYNPKWAKSDGILLYPAIGEEFDYTFEIDEHPIRVASVNLNCRWEDIQ
jgi:5-methylcytosine-specific restriction enzyme subunit McrC